MHQAGVINTVASLGTALTERQLRPYFTLYGRSGPFMILMRRAGCNSQGPECFCSAARNAKYGPNQNFCRNGSRRGKDPDEYIRNRAEAFRRIVADALSVMEYLMLVARKQSMVSGRLDARTYQNLACKYLSWEPERSPARAFGRRSGADFGSIGQTSFRRQACFHGDDGAGEEGINKAARKTGVGSPAAG